MLPATQYMLHLSVPLSIGTTLFAVMFTSMSGAWGHYKEGNVQVKWALYIGLGGLLGVALGSYVFQSYLSDQVHLLNVLLAALFAFVSYRMARESIAAWYTPSGPDAVGSKNLPLWTMSLLGFVTGSLTGMVGLGGGVILVPALIWLYGAKPYQAVGTALLAMFPITGVGALTKLIQGFVVLPVALLMGIGTILGSSLGVRLTHYISARYLKIIFTLLFVQLTVNYLLRSLN